MLGDKNLKKKIMITFIPAIIGIIFIFVGLLFGKDIASILTFNVQFIPEEKIRTFTYLPVFVGVYCLGISLILFKKFINIFLK